jgi:hypothetical protein
MDDLFQSLQRLAVLVPDSLAWQIAEICKELMVSKMNISNITLTLIFLAIEVMEAFSRVMDTVVSRW